MSSKLTYRSLSRRTALLGLVGLAGCSLTPVYGPNGGANALRGSVAFSMQDTVAGYRMRERFIERLGATDQRRFLLSVEQTQSPTTATITSDGDKTRFNLVGTAQYNLTDLNGQGVLSGEVETFTSYSATGSTIATQAAEVDASERLSIALADLIVARLLLISRELSE